MVVRLRSEAIATGLGLGGLEGAVNAFKDVRYSGPSDDFPGLDEVTVEVPRSLAGMGDADVTMTADGQTASPVRIQSQ